MRKSASLQQPIEVASNVPRSAPPLPKRPGRNVFVLLPRFPHASGTPCAPMLGFAEGFGRNEDRPVGWHGACWSVERGRRLNGSRFAKEGNPMGTMKAERLTGQPRLGQRGKEVQ